MSNEWVSFSDVPDHDEAPDECQQAGCDLRPSFAVGYRNPKEYVCYCKEHAIQNKNNMSGSRSIRRL